MDGVDTSDEGPAIAGGTRALVGRRQLCLLHVRPQRAAAVVEVRIDGDERRVALCAGHLRSFRSTLADWER